MNIWDLLKFRIKWIVEHYFRYTILHTWEYNYDLSKSFEEGCQNRKDYIHQISSILTLVERLERNELTLNTIAENQRGVIRKYVKFFRTFGLSEEVLEKDYSGTGTTFNLVAIDLSEITNKEDGKGVGNQEEQGEDTRETPGD